MEAIQYLTSTAFGQERKAMRIILPIGLLALFLTGCEEQTGPPSAAAPPTSEEPGELDDIVDVDALSRPGSGDYLGALSGAKQTAERLEDKIGDYNDDLEEEIDGLFDN